MDVSRKVWMSIVVGCVFLSFILLVLMSQRNKCVHNYFARKRIATPNYQDEETSTKETKTLQLVDFTELKRGFYKLLQTQRDQTIRHDYKFLKAGLSVQTTCEGMMQFGNLADGSKFVCSPWSLPRNCVIYSMGLANDVSFEQQIMSLGRTKNTDPLLVQRNCSIFGFDPGFKPKLYKNIPNVHGYAYTVGKETSENANTYTISDLMKKFGHGFVDIIKIDIESSEYKTLFPLIKKYVTPTRNNITCQILVEVHYATAEPLKMLETAGFLLFSKQENTLCYDCLELAYIHETCRQQYRASPKFLDNFIH